jgi:ATP phosphoribosyltransferase regulatory subunit
MAGPLARVREALIARGGTFVDLPMLVPANLVLELAGEGLRPRLFFTTTLDGEEMCLRPDLTIPAALRYIEEATIDDSLVAWGCQGPVFRAARPGDDRKPEFTQIGLERYGDHNTIQTDIDVFLSAYDACMSANIGQLYVRLCDGGLLPFVLTQASLPQVWRRALIEQAGHRRAFLRVLTQADGRTPHPALGSWESSLATLSFDQARERVAQKLEQSDLFLGVTRDVDEVTERLVSKAQRAQAEKLPPHVVRALQTLATYTPNCDVQTSIEEITQLGDAIGVDLKTWGGQWQERLGLIAEQLSGSLSNLRFVAIGEDAFDYYDGMAFDIATSTDFSRPVATGGRYDGLIEEISNGARSARAIGCVIRPDRFEGAKA